MNGIIIVTIITPNNKLGLRNGVEISYIQEEGETDENIMKKNDKEDDESGLSKEDQEFFRISHIANLTELDDKF